MQVLPPKTNNKNWLLTGIPRSGSTLALKLIADNQQVVGLDEPGWLKEIRQQADVGLIADSLLQKMADLRAQVKMGEPVSMNFGQGTDSLTDNHFARTEQGIIKTKQSQKVKLAASTCDKIWIVKSNVFFTALLNQLLKSKHFQLLVTVRDPIAVIKSWRSLDFSLSKGRSMIAEKFDPSSVVGHENEGVLVKQVLLLDWMFKKYYENINDISVFKYEDLVENPSIIGEQLNIRSVNKDMSLASRNNNAFYDHSESKEIETCIRKYGRYYQYFYPKLEGDFS
ncbi:hypothetical protein [Marinicella litoralis]|uniref:Sulfotransferase family protein n=1 Tax=Marinicella litoralis TaxID=644220 RepID=A0A4R6XZK3_9GAMM|nr:hypothetical protein [Marinicella litoralis]TDR23774.1 hypothetical protein C8D91_0640 [Marinicella litoralis]